MSENRALKEGDFAPDFTLDTDSGKAFSLSEQRGKKNVLIYFYPKDDTPGCTVEAQQLTQKADDFDALDTLVVGISKDSVEKHCKFRDKYDLKVILASDETISVCEAYGVWVEKNMYGKKYMGIQRNSYLVDKKGVIKKIWAKVKPDGHAEEALDAAGDL